MPTFFKRVASASLFGAVVFAAAASRADDRVPCPKDVPATTVCSSGRDANGAIWLVAIPEHWNHVLVMHAHGGPETSPPDIKRSFADLKRWSITVRAGYAWAGSTYRRGGYGVRMAAEDTENLRELFIERFGQPRRTIMHGQSWGGNVGAKVIELYNGETGGHRNYDGALLSSGVLAGGSRAYDFRLDLRAVYQYYCHDHPRADEPQYPLWMGLPADSTMTRAELAIRVKACTGAGLPAAERTDAQRRNLANILNVVRIPERTLVSHMSWATFLFADVVHKRLGDRNPFGNRNVRYTGSGDDAALNSGVLRYDADPAAIKQLADDADLTGKITVPVLTVHAIDDPTAFVEMESAYRETVQKAGNSDRLVQTFAMEHEHSYLSDPEYPALFAALLDWIDKGEKPTPLTVAARCEQFSKAYAGGCHFEPGYQPAPFEARTYSR
jgi:alpha-beta hydrolase superfamily lysophospholipase